MLSTSIIKTILQETKKLFQTMKSPGRFLCIDFSQAFVKIAYVESSGEGVKLLKYNLKKVGPIEESRAGVVAFIKEFLEVNSIQEKETSFTISAPESVIIKQLTLPVMPKEEMPHAIKWQLKTEAPFDLEKAALDWQIIKEFTDAEGAKKNEIMCIIAKSEVISNYLSIIAERNLSATRISHHPFNYPNILRTLQDGLKIVAVLDIGYSETTLCIYKENRLNFIRKLSFSSDKLTLALTPEFTYEKAEEIKRAFGIPQDEAASLSDNVQALRVILSMRPLLEGLAKELKRSFDYFMDNFKEEGPSLLYLSGGGASLKNLDWYLNKELNIKVSALALPTCVSIDSAEKEKINNDWNQIANILGLALAKAGSINLLPQEHRTKKIEFIETVSLRVTGIILGAIFISLFLIIQFQRGDYKRQLKNAEAHLQNLSEVRAIKEKVDLRQNLIAKIQKNKVPVGGLLKSISVLLPNNIILKELALEQNSHSLVLKGVVSVTGDTAETVLSTFMNKIETSPFFKEATLVSSKNSGGVHEFQIRCDLAR